ncbi:nuclear transport factor 2 family protein [Ottowia sp.]|uniref:nuclear transport factor 2 family protein n=1 Tax=Ottowia sp. TaxID=1898956 RepID=UPI002CE5709F|nr:nuclear transport factor 2 family protein [Ottowia sp.]HRN76210.1 nuclear transport factor 2 family protein [Ottowia sp.]HRQ02262.1 nuclear transport factor 2 family protein [Ottowia sp.]
MNARVFGNPFVDRYLAAYIGFDVPALLAMLSEDVCFETYANDRLTASARGIAEYEALARSSGALFSERSQALRSLSLWSDRGMAVIDFRGTLARDIPDGPPAGTVLELTARSEFRFQGDRITRITNRS